MALRATPFLRSVSAATFVAWTLFAIRIVLDLLKLLQTDPQKAQHSKMYTWGLVTSTEMLVFAALGILFALVALFTGRRFAIAGSAILCGLVGWAFGNQPLAFVHASSWSAFWSDFTSRWLSTAPPLLLLLLLPLWVVLYLRRPTQP